MTNFSPFKRWAKAQSLWVYLLQLPRIDCPSSSSGWVVSPGGLRHLIEESASLLKLEGKLKREISRHQIFQTFSYTEFFTSIETSCWFEVRFSISLEKWMKMVYITQVVENEYRVVMPCFIPLCCLIKCGRKEIP